MVVYVSADKEQIQFLERDLQLFVVVVFLNYFVNYKIRTALSFELFWIFSFISFYSNLINVYETQKIQPSLPNLTLLCCAPGLCSNIWHVNEDDNNNKQYKSSFYFFFYVWKKFSLAQRSLEIPFLVEVWLRITVSV